MTVGDLEAGKARLGYYNYVFWRMKKNVIYKFYLYVGQVIDYVLMKNYLK